MKMMGPMFAGEGLAVMAHVSSRRVYVDITAIL